MNERIRWIFCLCISLLMTAMIDSICSDLIGRESPAYGFDIYAGMTMGITACYVSRHWLATGQEKQEEGE